MAEKTALVVEDASNWAKQHQLSLTELGFKPSIAKDYADAAGLLRHENFDVAIIDLCLANQAEVDNLDGIFLLEHLAAKSVPILIVTGRLVREYVDKIYEIFDVFAILDKLSFNRKKFKEYVTKATQNQPSRTGVDRKTLKIRHEKIEQLVLEMLGKMPHPAPESKPTPTAFTAITASRPLRIFISHSSKDNALAGRLAGDLHADGFEVWYDKEQIHVGDTIIDKIDRGLSKCDYMIIVLSPEAVASAWVRKEVLMFINEELQRGHNVILPALYRDCEMPLLLEGRRFADFRASYEAGFAELRSALGIKPAKGNEK